MDTKFNMPLYTPGKQGDTCKEFGVVVGDLRSEISYLAYYECKNGTMHSVLEQNYSTKDFAGLTEMIKDFLAKNNLSDIQSICIAVPGPVVYGKVETPNLPWSLDEAQLKADLGVKKLYLINDLEATAYSLTEFDQEKLEILHTSENKIRGNVAVMAPGNGLGEAGMFWDGKNLHPFATEGGHTEFSPRNDFEVEFYHFLNKIYGIVSWENVLSKDGIYNVYRFLRDIGRHSEDVELKNRIANEDFLDVISDPELQKKSRLVNLTIEMYAEFLAREANNLVLKLKAIGALIITGDIPLKLFSLINKEKFYKDFVISDRMQHLLKDIPIYLVRNEKGILDGAAFYGAFIED